MQSRAKKGACHIGTSGWHYDHWRGTFYPSDVDSGGFLRYYASRLRTVEVNNTFYRLPDNRTVAQWRDTVPDGFTFAVKANRYITHRKKLKDPEMAVGKMIGVVTLLGDKLGPILFQLPPKWRANARRLEAFAEVLPRGQRCAFEFRDASWFNERVYEVLRAHTLALCIHDFHGQPSPRVTTTNWVYVRLHGPSAQYEGKYGKGLLSEWAEALSRWTSEGKDVYCYFNNDMEGYAPANAEGLRAMVEESVSD